MGLNIVAKRKFSLKGFAEGWDDCFIIVRAANEQQRKAHTAGLLKSQDRMNEAIASEDQAQIQAVAHELEDVADEKVRDFALDLIESGRVVSTKDDGTTELVDFTKEDAPVVVDALGFSWLNSLIEVATGTDRLKAQANWRK